MESKKNFLDSSKKAIQLDQLHYLLENITPAL